MKILDKLFHRTPIKGDSEDVLKIAAIIGPLIDKTVNDIFRSYRKELVTEPITYIVPGVWGAKKKGGTLDHNILMYRRESVLSF